MLGHGLTIVLALCAAIFMAIGIVVRQRATMDVPSEDGVSTRMLATLLRRPLWWAGTGAAVLGFVFQALALIKGSLIVVQPILVSALLFTLPLSARLSGRRVTRTEWLWAGLLTVGLAVFVLLAKPGPQETPSSMTLAVIVSVACVVLVLACVVVAVRFPAGWQRAVLLAVAVGFLFGMVAMVTKIVMHMGADRGLLGVLATPAPYALVALGVFATLLQQSAFHAGALQTSVPTMLVLEPVVAILLGAVVLGEELDAGGAAAIALTIALAAMTVATVALAREEGAYEAELELKAARDPA
ncbi:DMT family transporter [Mycolicibacterium arenosum]|uniref:DMT family transporter n=1 Tax=Mycolicibacterium arenosum TaxID=2952157 RepID=A0ABT1M681_9MYCO|nr:DMT family transporter [Mycolicibacterium sp. CAU 1645]MCP9274689.1 DMT family transporter [Mycolicibacterium sp. CAU 1645]